MTAPRHPPGLKSAAAAMLLGGITLAAACTAPRIETKLDLAPRLVEAAVGHPASAVRIYALDGNQTRFVPVPTASEWCAETLARLHAAHPELQLAVYRVRFTNRLRLHTSAEQVAGWIEDHVQERPLLPGERVILFGHCQGALILSHLLHEHAADATAFAAIPWEHFRGLLTVDPPLIGGWISGPTWWDVLWRAMDLMVLGLGPDLVYPISRDMRPESPILAQCRDPAPGEWRLVRRRPDGSLVFHQTSGADAGGIWDHDPFQLANRAANPANGPLLAELERLLCDLVLDRAVPPAASTPSGGTNAPTCAPH